MKDWDLDQAGLDFLKEDREDYRPMKGPPYKLLVADDDEEVHKVSRLMLKDFEFEGRGIEILHAYSGEETLRVCRENPDIAILFLDVVMESNHSGLKVVETLRNEDKNKLIRIILRTGQPGEAPEDEVIKKYDINDYRLKTELTMRRLHTTLYTTLRNYRDLTSIEKHRRGLQKILEASSRLFAHNSLDDFLKSILEELSNFQEDNYPMVYIREKDTRPSNGFASLKQNNEHIIVSATGKYEVYVGEHIDKLPNYDEIYASIQSSGDARDIILPLSKGFIVKSLGASRVNNFIFIEGANESFDFDLIKIFLSSFSLALDNYLSIHE
ncbi:MAG: DUF3369 domain-containing protein [Tissierellaceae bacterium]